MNKSITFSCANPPVEEMDGVAAPFTILSKTPVPFDENGEIKYALFNLTEDMTEVKQMEMLKLTFDEINHQIYPLRIIHTHNPDEAYFKIHFVHEDGNIYDRNDDFAFKCPYDFTPTTLAVQYANYGGKWSGHCFVNDKFLFKLRDDGQEKDIVKILIHEVGGHGMGLGHTDIKPDILFPIYDPTHYWTKDSTAGILSLYKDKMRSVVANDDRKALMFSALGEDNCSKLVTKKSPDKAIVKRSAGVKRRGGGVVRFKKRR